MRVEDLAGKKFGLLTPIKRQGSDKHGRAVWLCQCDCGKQTKVNSNNLKWTVSSCGCLRGKYKTTPIKISGNLPL